MMLLSIENLRTYFYSRPKRAFVRSVDGASLAVARGETLGVVGESGSGKTVAALSAAGLVSGTPGVIGGSIEFKSRNLLDGLERYVKVEERDGRVMAVQKDERGWARRAETLMAGVRGKQIAMIFQNPRAALNPYSTVGAQLVETIRLHTRYKTKN
jgi:ABC-type dipeptide/oligopeptide/nickel transport system ATPase component